MPDTGFYIGTERTLNSTGSVFIGGVNVPDSDRTTYQNNEIVITADGSDVRLRFGKGIDLDKGKIIIGQEQGYFSGNISYAWMYRIDNQLKVQPDPESFYRSGLEGNMANFGFNVAIADNLIVVGAPTYEGDSSAADYLDDRGRAYLYKVPEGLSYSTIKPTLLGAIDDPNPSSTKNNFGDTVAIGNGVVAVATEHDSLSGNTGRVCVFDYDRNHLYTLTGDGFSSGERNAFGSGSFSNSLAIGHGRIVVGASAEDNDLGDGEGTRNTGAVYVYDVKNGIRLFKLLPPTTQNPGYSLPNSAFGTSQNSYDPNNFGISVAIGCGKIVVGDAYADYGGWVHVYDIYGNYERSFNSGKGGATDTGDRFGASVAIGGGYIAVGADSDDDGGAVHTSAGGTVTLFDLNGNEYFTLDPANPQSGLNYGEKVRIGSGKLLVAASDYEDSSGSTTKDGAVFLYELEENTDSIVDRMIDGYKY